MYCDTKIAIPIFKKNKEHILNVAKEYIKKGADILELRIDGIDCPNPREIRHIIEEINFPLIATNRIKSEGGFFKGSEEERVNILLECVDVSDYVDIELVTAPNLRDKIIETGVKTIISYHDFEKTPSLDEMFSIIEKEQAIGNIAKIAVMPHELEDTLDVLLILSHFDNVIAISMGEIGSYTRVIAPKFKAPITFASSDDVTAPGQIDIETMKLLLNMDLINTENLIK